MELYIVDDREGELFTLEEQEEWQLFFEGLALECLEQVDHPSLNAEVSLVLTTDEKIHALNKQYRQIDAPTDVLSFAMEETTEEEEDYDDPFAGQILGDIVISLDTAKRQAQEFGHSLRRELGFLFVHGMCHLLGYDHQGEEDTKAMRELEEKVLAARGVTRE